MLFRSQQIDVGHRTSGQVDALPEAAVDLLNAGILFLRLPQKHLAVLIPWAGEYSLYQLGKALVHRHHQKNYRIVSNSCQLSFFVLWSLCIISARGSPQFFCIITITEGRCVYEYSKNPARYSANYSKQAADAAHERPSAGIGGQLDKMVGPIPASWGLRNGITAQIPAGVWDKTDFIWRYSL